MSTLSTDQALYNITKAYLDYCVSNRLYWDTFSTIETGRDYHTDKATYQTMRQCYIECGILDIVEIDAATENKYRLEKIKPAE